MKIRSLFYTLIGWMSILFIPIMVNAAPVSYTPTALYTDGDLRYSEPVAPIRSAAVATLPNRAITPATSAYWLMPDRVINVGGKADAYDDPALFDWRELYGVNSRVSPPLLRSFDGADNAHNPFLLAPPDPTGDVGPRYYVQVINVSFVVYDKTGKVIKPQTPLEDLWKAQTGYCAGNKERIIDPVVLYDQLADRWLIAHGSQQSAWCIAVSQTSDPTGPYYLYEYDLESFPDFQKFAVWPDGYYASSANAQYAVAAFDRENMLKGQRARMIAFKANGKTVFPYLLPADLDGYIPPKPDDYGVDAYFYIPRNKESPENPGAPRIDLYKFNSEFGRPQDSSFSLAQSIPLKDFSFKVCLTPSQGCIPQPAPGFALDPVEGIPSFRFVFRNVGAESSLVGAFTVGLSTTKIRAGIRWFELRQTSGRGNPWHLHQEGTLGPQFADIYSRWMGSIAMDGNRNIALGYSISGDTLKPGIRYATRLATDPLGTLSEEAVLVAGSGVQTGRARYRWGDYSMMAIDPSDDCTFWYTNEYYKVTGDLWSTRIGAFKMPTCVPTTFTISGQVKDQQGNPLSGVVIRTNGQRATASNTAGTYQLRRLPAGRYTVWATREGYFFQPWTTQVNVPPLQSTVNFIGTPWPE